MGTSPGVALTKPAHYLPLRTTCSPPRPPGTRVCQKLLASFHEKTRAHGDEIGATLTSANNVGKKCPHRDILRIVGTELYK